jgi:hypothetical protein
MQSEKITLHYPALRKETAGKGNHRNDWGPLQELDPDKEELYSSEGRSRTTH